MPFINTTQYITDIDLSFCEYQLARVLPFTVIDPSDEKLKETPLPNAKYYITGGLYEKKGQKIRHSERIGRIGGDYALSVNPERLKPLPLYYKYVRRCFQRHSSGNLMKYPFIPGRSLYLGHWMGHYGHFITEFLSHLWCIDQLSEIDQIVVLPFLFDERKVVVKSWHKTLLQRLGLSHIDIVVLDKQYILDQVVVPQQGWIVNQTVNRQIKLVYEKITLSSAESNQKGLYFLSRKQEHYKRLANLAEIEAVFERHNFKIVFPENLSMIEQLDIYSSASCLASTSGTGLHNSVFAKSSALIIELGDMRNRQKTLPMQRGATELLNQKHFFIPYQGSSNGVLDVSLLEIELKTILAEKEVV